MALIAKPPARLFMYALSSIMVEKKIVASRLVAFAIARADSLRRISVEEKPFALPAETPVPLAGTGRIIIGKIVGLNTSSSFLGSMWPVGRHAVGGTAAFILISVEEEQVAIDAMGPSFLARWHGERARDRGVENKR
jgi:hypothetical protein